ncbi:uncharacterized protein DUF4383 [Thermosporothrix hazakensis]|jgi:hypothetical protein|uniref:Uncharacterized protein DUF4383 n=2 Tax=Thermosporothrix TaxID=768650 RepID=A0A326UBY7_THEHA|nr:DUF4383 domain-containing protein [Thermosporothrix hazakensis]PZW36132.1 uncharacterized protein DUF4383 [Thermosporothrix hazakensis]BBH88598.1 hypothetical protein KTC_33490 [Thermosporothrix sp. COM3]GCE46783.1 hypothetical protein KTH_16520 [Thermosporothrix hazakensis]
MIWTANRILSLILGIVFTIIGIVGFFFSSTMRVANMGGFDVDVVHNIVHLVTGIIALIATFMPWSRLFNQIFGVVYTLLGLAGLVYPAFYFDHRLLGIMHVNAVDHVLHLVAGIIALAVGFFVTGTEIRRTPTPTS